MKRAVHEGKIRKSRGALFVAIVKRAGIAAGGPRVTCHLLRHAFATAYLVRQVGDLLRLQQILGHTSLEMVRHYVAMANVQRSLIDRRDSPMDLIASGHQVARSTRRLQPRRRWPHQLQAASAIEDRKTKLRPSQ